MSLKVKILLFSSNKKAGSVKPAECKVVERSKSGEK
jgi:hypothetical protein